MRAVEHGDVADAVHQRARGPRGELVEERLARLAIAAGRLHFDELVTGKGARGLAGYCLGQAGVA